MALITDSCLGATGNVPMHWSSHADMLGGPWPLSEQKTNHRQVPRGLSSQLLGKCCKEALHTLYPNQLALLLTEEHLEKMVSWIRRREISLGPTAG